MIKPIEDLIATMKAEGWPEPSVLTLQPNTDGSGPEKFVLLWPLVHAIYQTGHGWREIVSQYGGGGMVPMPFCKSNEIPTIDQADCPGLLKRFAASAQRCKDYNGYQ